MSWTVASGTDKFLARAERLVGTSGMVISR
jgi:hypothetical protein